MRAFGFGCLIATLLLWGGCSKKGGWLVGQWLLLDQDGKPGVCHEFKKEGGFIAYTSAECSGDKDQVSSGRWEMKDDTKLGIIRYNERKGQLVMITEKDAEKFVARGAIAGTMFKVGPKTVAQIMEDWEKKGLVKIKPLDPALGCRQIALPLKDIRALPAATVEDVRMLRQKDTALKFHLNKNSADPRIEKVVYALNDESLEWISLELTGPAFNTPGPLSSLTSSIGSPLDQVTTGTGEQQQHIVMWKAYCALTRDQPKRDIDVTLFTTLARKRGTIYVSDNVVSGLWEELKQMAANPENQQSAEEQAEDEESDKAEAKTEAKPEAKPAAKAPPAKPAPEPKAAPPKKAGKPGKEPAKGGSDDDDI